jgi:Mg-chelatase subunit ChlI
MAKQRTIEGPDPERPTTHVLVVRPVKDGEKMTEARYSMYSGWPVWADRIVALRQAEINGKWTDDEQTEAARYFNAYDYTLGVTESQRVREAAAANSTEITVDGVKRDLMDLPLARLIRGINGILTAEQDTGKEAPNAYHVARRRLLADNKARLADANEPDGDIVAA